MSGWRLWKFCLPLSLFLFGCSESNIGVRTSPSTGDRGIRGPNLLQFPNLEAAKEYRAEQRKIDIAMSKILMKLHATPNSDERTRLKSEWVSLDKEIFAARSAFELRGKGAKVQALDAKVAAPGAPVEAPVKNEIEYLREEYLIVLAGQAQSMLELRRIVRDVKPFAEDMTGDELTAWGSAAHYVETFEVNYGFIRASIRNVGTLEEMADISRQLKAMDPKRNQPHLEQMRNLKIRLVPATPEEPSADLGKNE